MVREHLREYHGIKGKRKSVQNPRNYMDSKLTENTEAVEM